MQKMIKNVILQRLFNPPFPPKHGWLQLIASESRWYPWSLPDGAASYASSLPDSFYNEGQKEIQKKVRELIATKIDPFVDKWEADEYTPSHEVVKLFASVDCLGINKPQAFLEELGSINSIGVSTTIAVLTDMALPALSKFGSDELKKEFLVPSIKGDRVACIGVSEPAAGSDVAGMLTTGKRNGDDLIINGQKVWISSGMQADWMCLLANTSEGKPHKNKSLICLPLDLKGVSRRAIPKLGTKSNDWGHIFFEDVRVPVKNIIGEEGMGFIYQMQQFQEERLSISLNTLRQLDTILENTINYTRFRKTFGKSVLDNQVVHFRLAELATEVESLRALTYQAVDKYNVKEDVTMLASMLKLKTGRLSRELVDSCLHYWGAMGYSEEQLVTRSYRDLRHYSIAGGADEIMLRIICKHMDIYPPNDCYRTSSIK